MINNIVEIKDPSGNVIREHKFSSNCVRKFSLMSEDSVTLRFFEAEYKYFPVGSSVTIDNQMFYITKEQPGKWNNSTGVWDYELKFDAYYWLWANKIFRYVEDLKGGLYSAADSSFVLTATIEVHANMLLKCLSYLEIKYNDTPFSVDTAPSLSQEAKPVRYENVSVLGAIQAIAEAFDCEWWVIENVINFGKCENTGSLEKFKFEAGKNVSSISFQNNSTEVPNRLYVYGSDRNLPRGYRKSTDGESSSGVVTRRLMLPLKENLNPNSAVYNYIHENAGGVTYLQKESEMPEHQIVEKVVVFDSVYPRTVLSVSEEPESYISSAPNGEEEAATETFYRIKYNKDFHFSEKYILPNAELHIIFQSGMLNGMDFAVKFNPNGLSERDTEGNLNPEAQIFEIIANEDYGRKLPDDILKPKKEDEFIIYGWDSNRLEDLGLIEKAERELLEEGIKALEEYTKDLSSCTCPMAWDYMKPLFESDTQPKAGDFVTIIDQAHFGEGGRESRIIGYEYKLDLPYAECVYTCGENISEKRLDSIEKKIEGLTKSGEKIQMQNSLDFLSKRYTDRTPYGLASDVGFEVGRFMSGVSGAKIGRDAESGHTFAELDELYVRVRAFFESLTVIEREALAGEQQITPGGGVKCSFVVGMDASGKVIAADEHTPIAKLLAADKSADVLKGPGVSEVSAYRCYFLSEQDGEKRETFIKAGDQVISQEWNAREGTTNKVSNRRWWRLVTDVNQDALTDDVGNHYGYIEVSKADCESNSDIPEAGDDIVQFGNRTESTRQTAIVISTVSSDAPSMKLFTGIGSGTTNAEHYSLNDRDIISYGFDRAKGRAYMQCYGDMYFGDREGKTWIKYDAGNKEFEIKAKISALSTIGDDTLEKYVNEGKRRIFTSQPKPPYEVGDLWVNATYPAGTTAENRNPNLFNPKYYNDILRCKVSRSDSLISQPVEPSTEGSLKAPAQNTFHISDWELASNYTDDTKANQAITEIAGYQYIRQAIADGATTIHGGLILSSLIKLGTWDRTDLTEPLQDKIYAGMNGIYNHPKTIASWWGGDMVDKFYQDIEESGKVKYKLLDTPLVSGFASALIRMDGTGYFSKGNIGWREDGSGWLAGDNITWDGTGAITFSNGIRIGDDETLGSVVTMLNNLSNAFKPVILENKVPKVTTWDKIKTEGTGTNLYAIQATKSFYSKESIAANGVNSTAGTSGGATTLGGLNNVTPDADNVQSDRKILIREANASTWTLSSLSEIAGLDTVALAEYLSHNDYAQKSDLPSLSNYVTLDTAQTISGGKMFTNYISLIGSHYSNAATRLSKGVLSFREYNYSDTFGIWCDFSGTGTQQNLFIGGSGTGENLANTTDDAAYTPYLTINHTTGNLTVKGNIIKNGGTSSQFLKADGSVDSNSYALSSSLSNYLKLTGGTLTGPLTIKKDGFGDQLHILRNSGGNAVVKYSNNVEGLLGYLGINYQRKPYFETASNQSYNLWHEGNDGSGSGLDADLLDGWHATGSSGNAIKKSGFVATETGDLASYWCKLATITVANDNNNSDVTLYLHSAYNQQYGILLLNARSSSTSPSWNARMLDGNIPPKDIRFYRQSSTGTTYELWVNVKAKWGVMNAVVLSETKRVGAESGSSVTLHSTIFSTVQTPTLTEFIKPAYIDLQNNAASATKLSDNAAKTAWGQPFFNNGKPQSVSGDMSNVGNITPSGNNAYDCGSTSNHWNAVRTRQIVSGVDSPLYIWQSKNQDIVFATNNTTARMTISGNGKVWIGWNVQDSSALGLVDEETGWNFSTYFNGSIYALGNVRANAGYFHNFVKVNGQFRAYDNAYFSKNVAVEGAVASRGVTSNSDERLKDIVEDCIIPLEAIAEAPSVRFKWKDTHLMDVGSIAQYWEKVCPEFVAENEEGKKSMAYGKAALMSAISLAKETETLKKELAETGRELAAVKSELSELRQMVEQLMRGGTEHA